MKTVKAHPVLTFFVLAFAISWAVWASMAVTGARVYQGSGWPTHVPGLLGPAVAALVVSAVVAGRAGLADLGRRTFRWRVGPAWYLIAVSPLAFFAVAAAASGTVDLAGLGRFSGLPAVAAPLMLALLILAGFAEEIGWRGYALARLLSTHSLLTAALVVGVVWAAWHLPLFLVIDNYRQLGPTVLPMFVLGIVSGSIFLAWLYRATGSVLLCALWHATYNLTSGTAAAQGTVAAVVSAAVMASAALIVLNEVWRRLLSGQSRRSHSPA